MKKLTLEIHSPKVSLIAVSSSECVTREMTVGQWQ